jgi:hypothetical protein
MVKMECLAIFWVLEVVKKASLEIVDLAEEG